MLMMICSLNGYMFKVEDRVVIPDDDDGGNDDIHDDSLYQTVSG